MIPLTLADVAAATGGRLAGGAQPGTPVTGAVVADSREASPGGLFVALAGEHADGHAFVTAALGAGAVAAITGHEVAGPCVVVEDQVVALGRLARAVLERAPAVTVVAVTGSSGKTSTKDLLAHLLDDLGPTVAPKGSYNNELGLPLSALRLDGATRFLISEMGARMPGNISYLCEITPPRIGVVLNVGAAHAGVFGSRAATASAKAELVAALPADGVAVLNHDDPLVRAMPDRVGPKGTTGRIVWTGIGEGADVRAVDIRVDAAARASFRLCAPAGEAEVRLALHGAHQVSNALAAAAVGLELGQDVERVAALLSSAQTRSRARMDVRERVDGVTVINDAYNANPESMRAALEALAVMGAGDLAAAGRGPGRGEPRRTWAVLGEMLELGEESAAAHREVGALAARLSVGRIVAVGAGARPVCDGVALGEAEITDAAGPAVAASTLRHGVGRDEPDWVPDVQAALALLREQVRPGDVVLVKASRSIGLDRIADDLVSDGVPATGAAS